VIGSIVEYLFAPDEPEAVIEQLADEQTDSVFDGDRRRLPLPRRHQGFDASNLDVADDLAPGAVPKAVFG
jgi:mannitol 2-dehydrogenase